MADPQKLIIGVDFGTTFSGIAYCDYTGAKEGMRGIQVFDAWPGGQRTGTNEKTPSRLWYHPENEVRYGNQITSRCKGEIHSCMKLKLDNGTSALASELARLNFEDQEHSTRDVLELCSDYLRAVYSTVSKELLKQYSKALLTSLRKEYVVTVPAVWSERAKSLTLQAVRNAGIAEEEGETVSLVIEPEAAAVYALKEAIENANKVDIEVGSVFTLCDAGGGTVDLISYRITQIDPVLRFEEAVVGTGDKCGATFVNAEFLKWLKAWISPRTFNKIPRFETQYGSKLMNSFEMSMRGFGHEQDDEYTVQLPSKYCPQEDPELQIEDFSLTLNEDQMKQIFDPVVKRILDLVGGQIEAIQEAGLAGPKMVLVVGGFGSNCYLYDQIRLYCDQLGIGTRKPKHPWSAVARGAVCRGIEGVNDRSITSRLARYCYGTSSSPIWDASKHHKDDYYLDDCDGRERANGQMRWLVMKGERLPDVEPRTMTIKLFRYLRATERAVCAGVLYSYPENDPPARKAGNVALKQVCRIEGNLTSLPLSSFERRTTARTGEFFWIVPFTLRATFSNAGITWQCLYKGQEKGSVTVDYDV
ncbi:hypothetical protein FSARC_6566 [Fusarium sarcochroum]|uniref:Actin-like ATPase domain-containing protein n=1 Tax=Fusarium sarcochroum TaxID=1208366 RepID=A0A8H4X985_9HYPO|nr:hypothetical protein FSARC_6566 [Fusarium sarcochroum]